MKVFISHKQEDATAALAILRVFRSHEVDTYLDVLDSFGDDGEALTNHIKAQLNTCTDIVVVISEKTKDSWWVPFEVGMAAQIDMPTASFLQSGVILPSFLSYWPRLKSELDVKKYIEIRRNVETEMQSRYENFSVASRRRFETPEFYRQLKSALQR